MLDWAIQNLGVDHDGNIVVDKNVTCSQANFSSMFANIVAPPTYAALSAMPIATVGGWQQHFDSWKTRGLIS